MGYGASAAGAADITVWGGTVEIADGATNAENIELGGTFSFEVLAGGTGTYSGNITNTEWDPGAVIKTGAGTLVLTGVNAPLGGMILREGTVRPDDEAALGSAELYFDGGTLQASNDLTLSVPRSIFIDAGGAAFDTNGFTITVDRDIADYGGGSLSKLGLGTLVLTGTNSYSGGTTVSAGTLALEGGSALLDTGAVALMGGNLDVRASETIGSLSGTGGTVGVAAGQTLTVNQAEEAIFAGVLQGVGGFVKSGSAELELAGASAAFTGPVTITDGVLLLNGSLASSAVTVAGGALGGSGTVASLTVASGGSVAPGGSGLGTLNVIGNATFGAGSFLDVDLTSSASDLLQVGGTATLDGMVRVTLLDPQTSYMDGTIYQIVQATALAGSFAGVSESSAFLDFTLSQTLSEVFLTAEWVADFASAGETPNQRQVADALQDFDLTPGSDSLAVFNALLMLSADEARAAYDLASGEAHASFQHTILDIGGLFGSTLQRRAGLLLGADTSGIASRPLGYSMGGRTGSLPFHALGADLPDVPVETLPTAGDTRTLGVWAGLLGGVGTIDGDANAAALDHRIGGIAGGIDGAFDALGGSVLLGVGAGYSATTAEVDARRSSADIDSAHVGIYGAWDNDTLRLSAAAAYAFHDIETTRRIVFPGVDETAEADYDGHSVVLSGEAAWRVPLGGITLAPLATIDYLAGRHDAATETGAGALNLTLDAERYERLQTGVGIALGTQWAMGTALVSAEARLVWGHGFGDDAPAQDLAFAGAPGSPVTVIGPDRADDWLAVGAGIGVSVTDAVSVTTRYDGAFSGSGNTHQGSLSVGLRF